MSTNHPGFIHIIIPVIKLGLAVTREAIVAVRYLG